MRFRPLRALAVVVVANLAIAVGVVVPGAGESAPPSSAAGVGTGEPFGDATDFGSMAGRPLAEAVVGIAATRTGGGYWLVAEDGGVFSFGDARFHGSTGAIRLNKPIVGITPTPTGGGYWFVASDGGVFSFGDARFHGSTGAIRLNQPIVGMAATPTGGGYWLVASDGGIFAFGDARFLGSTGDRALGAPIAGMTSTASGQGYWLVGADGAVFAFGDAVAAGSAVGRSSRFVVGMATAGGRGYWLATSDGTVFALGDATSFGSASTSGTVVGIAATPSRRGYWLATADGDVLSAVTGPAAAGTYSFLRIGRDGEPVRYNPCADVTYVVNPALAPSGAVAEIHTAFARLSAATGIRFVDGGSTTEPHVGFGHRRSYQPERYGERWAPILVSWTTESVEPLLAGGTLGYGGSTSYWSNQSDEAFVTGQVVFDIDQTLLRPGFGAGLTRGNLVLHELGHVVGLDHIEDRSQLMYPSLHQGSGDGFAAGDLIGLSLLGAREGCLTVANPG